MEYAHTINGEAGRMFDRHEWQHGSGLFSTQTWKASKQLGNGRSITVNLRFDDNCRNGSMTFSATADIVNIKLCGDKTESCGCLHDEIARHFPGLAPLLKWHLTSTDGPMHYLANTLYWLGRSGYTDGKPNSPPNLEYARSTAVWPEMPADVTESELRERLPALLSAFHTDMEATGFEWRTVPQVAA
jgi:hypothetical protein